MKLCIKVTHTINAKEWSFAQRLQAMPKNEAGRRNTIDIFENEASMIQSMH